MTSRRYRIKVMQSAYFTRSSCSDIFTPILIVQSAFPVLLPSTARAAFGGESAKRQPRMTWRWTDTTILPEVHFVTLDKDYVGQKAGTTRDIDKPHTKGLLDESIVKTVPGDRYGPLMTKALRSR